MSATNPSESVCRAMRGEGPPPEWYCYEPMPGEGQPVAPKPKRAKPSKYGRGMPDGAKTGKYIPMKTRSR